MATCDVRSGTFSKRLVAANHTWWYNMPPLKCLLKEMLENPCQDIEAVPVRYLISTALQSINLTPNLLRQSISVYTPGPVGACHGNSVRTGRAQEVNTLLLCVVCCPPTRLHRATQIRLSSKLKIVLSQAI